MLERIEARLGEIEAQPDPALREAARGLVRDILEFHAAGLGRLLELAGDEGRRYAGDPAVAALLLLHGLHPDPLEVRVERALESVRPYLGSHGGSVELVGLSDGVVRLRLLGSCHGCPSSAQTLRDRVEQALLEAAPDAEGVEIA